MVILVWMPAYAGMTDLNSLTVLIDLEEYIFLNPSRFASSVIFSSRRDERISPSSPTSPTKIELAGRAMFLKEEIKEAMKPRSAVVDLIDTPPTTLTNTSKRSSGR